MNTYKNPICIVLWRDATFSNQKVVPDTMPLLQITTGFVIESNDDFIHMSTSVGYNHDTEVIIPTDGILIPQKMIVDFKRIGDLPELKNE